MGDGLAVLVNSPPAVPKGLHPPCPCAGRAPLVERKVWSSLGGFVQSPPWCGPPVAPRCPGRLGCFHRKDPSPAPPVCVYKVLHPAGMLPVALFVMPASRISGESHPVTCKRPDAWYPEGASF